MLIRVLALTGATALASIPIFVLLDTALSSSVQAPSGPPSPVSSSQTQQAEAQYCSARDASILVIYLHQTDLTTGSLVANLSLCMGRSVANQVISEAPHSNSGAPMLSISGFESTFTARLLPIADSQVQNGGTLQAIGSVTEPLDGYPRSYPLDHYSSTITVSVFGACPVGDEGRLNLEVLADPGVGSFNWSTVQPSVNAVGAVSETASPGRAPRFNCGPYGASVALEATRPATTQLFVVSLVAIPLLLISLLGLRLSGGTPRSIDGLVGVTAIMLAILPIRAVLVPSGITSLTLVDFALASEMALLATGTVFWFVWPRTAPEASGQSAAAGE